MQRVFIKKEWNGMEILKDNICSWKDAMSRDWCDALIQIVDQKINQAIERGGTPEEDVDGICIRDNRKRNDISLVMHRFDSLKTHQRDIHDTLRGCLTDMNEHYTECGAPRWDMLETLECKIQKTPPGGGFCQWHYEQGSCTHTSRRWGVWMIYLNDVEKGGKTDFPNQGLSVKPEAGKVVIWPACYTHPHRSAPDLQENKYIVTGWFIYHGDELTPKDPTV